MLRWWVIPRNKYFNVYLHHFLRRDEDRALHDHPWWSISFIFEGCYFEHKDDGVSERKAGEIAWRGATSRHRISLPLDYTGEEMPCWTIFVTGPKVREWGFWCRKVTDAGPGRFVDWRDFTGSDHNKTGVGSIGAGCGEDL